MFLRKQEEKEGEKEGGKDSQLIWRDLQSQSDAEAGGFGSKQEAR